MTDWTKEYTVGDVATIYAQWLGEQPADHIARRLRHILQQDVIQPRRRGEGRYARALFNKEDVLFTRLILALADAGTSNEHMAVAGKCRDNVVDLPIGTEHASGFAVVLDGIRAGEEWFFNLHLSRTGQHVGGFARTPEKGPELLNIFATVTLPCAPLLHPLLATLPADRAPESARLTDDEAAPIKREDEDHDGRLPPRLGGD